MSKTHRLSLTLAAFAAWLGTGGIVGLEAAEAPEGAPQGKSAVMETYAAPGGETYFAMKLSPRLRQPKLAAHDVVVLFDTSASQAGAYREKALMALEALLAGLETRDRIALSAVDLNAINLTPSFVAAGGVEMRRALVELRGRVPLGSTDMGGAMRSALARFAEAGDTGRVRSVVYIGDGVSTARSIAAGRMQNLVDSLVEARISVSSYAVGPVLNNQLLGALANHTGGMLVVDSEQGDNKQVNDEQADAMRIGGLLAMAAHGAVVWPVSASYPDAFSEVFPGRVPPLRFDRDTVLMGTLGADVRGELRMSAELAGQTVELAWPLAVAPPDEEHAYLAKLVEIARQDGGIGLPTVGAAGLDELRRTVHVDAQNLTRLGQQALASGNLDQAEKLVAEAARLDPENNEAAIVRSAVGKATLASQRRAPRDLRLSQRPAAGDDAAPSDDIPREAADGSLVDEVERNDRIFTGYIRTEVENTIKRARSMLSVNPQQAEQDLKLLLEKIAQSVELAPDVRAQLVERLEATLRTARRQAEDLAEREIRDEQIRAEQAAREQINRDLFIREQKVEQLMARFSALMDEERYRDAEAIADLAEEMEPNRAGLRTAELWSRMTGYKTDIYALRDARHRGFVDMLYATETSHVPTSDEPPILYPDPEVWQMLTERRKKYKAVDLAKNSPAEQKIAAALTDKTELDFTDQPLSDVIEYLKAKHEIEIQLDSKALADAGVGSDTTVTRNIRGITLRSALRLLLGELDLTYVIKDEVLLITTKAEAENILSTKVYPVADLVIPVQGIGVGGGGGGRGMFTVKDDLKLSGKKKPAEAAEPAGAKKLAGERPGAARAPAGAMGPRRPGAKGRGANRAKTAEPVRIDFAEGDDPEVRWNDLFAKHIEDKLPTDGVRQAARELMKAQKFDHVIALINAALRNKQGQPWMYEALGLAMQAAKRDSVEIERVLMSAVDFTEDPMDVMYIAHYMAKNGLESRALKLFEQVSESAPNAAEPFVIGLRLAQQLDDIDGIRWATVGILSQAWSAEHIEIWNSANLVASSTLDRLKKENRSLEAQEYQAQIDEALVRDCVVIVSWTGDADVDLFVEEPAGTICSFRNPRTTSGGILLGDTMARQEGLKSQGASEVYVCPKGFDGTYKLAVRRVWGKLTADQVRVELIWHYKAAQERFQVKQLNLKDGDAVAAFDLKEGRRQEPLAQQQVANAVAGQMAVNQQILNQQLNALNDPRVLGSMLRGVNRGNGGVIVNPVNPFFVQGAVGYMPITSCLPKGAGMFVNSAVVSADRRYVRVNPIPFFTGVTQVNTFNFVTGATGGASQAGGGGGGVSTGNGGGF